MELKVENLNVNYDDKKILKDISFNVKNGEIVTIIGPNGSGKSTLIKSISRYLKPASGKIYLNKVNINQINTKEIARNLAVLPQVKGVSSDISIEELVSYGRFPHLKFGRRLGIEDKEIISWALEKTGLMEMKDRYVVTLSGGERQRAWIAMSLAQKPKILLLDEPTTFLDICYQLETLELVKELNKTLGITVVMVLHDLNQAARYSDNILVINNGELWEYGEPCKVISEGLLKHIFKIDADIYEDKINNCPYFIPRKITA
ncbi:ABC transporter ATP-binding protein [Sedimentibacter sp. MB31-C6]|uniref:ABC transporter ATP-binding protein n=1 Tax=Sedimentibacter sp. MB31-C6 TaxID=3109366 RepID=UPI002DDCD141|nr:ABC transporter ATP-binding protein [Sedimentibacter sp. MB36-C1]WSI02837.1 ABC transporter ATP-binding protein [Sedimentibacter sp. MB36-C1]